MTVRYASVLRLGCIAVLCCILMGCNSPLSREQGPPPTPTPLLAPYNAAIVAAQTAGDAKAQALAYYERGNVLFDQGDNKAAIADYTQSVELDPTNSRAFNNRALANVALGQTDQALADYTAAIKIDPTYVRAYQNRIRLLEQLGFLKSVAANYGELARLDPKNAADYLYRQGSALHSLRDFAGARKAYDAALAANPEQVDALYERGLLSFAEGNPTAAIDDLDRAIRLSPRAANAFYARGHAREALGDHNAAIADFSQALKLRADYADAFVARAAAYHAAGRDDRARADLAALNDMELDATLQAAVTALRQQLGTT